MGLELWAADFRDLSARLVENLLVAKVFRFKPMPVFEL